MLSKPWQVCTSVGVVPSVYHTDPSIGYSRKFDPTLVPGMGSFVKLPYQPRPGLGSKIDFGWYAIGIHYTPSIETGTRLVCGRCILYTWY